MYTFSYRHIYEELIPLHSSKLIQIEALYDEYKMLEGKSLDYIVFYNMVEAMFDREFTDAFDSLKRLVKRDNIPILREYCINLIEGLGSYICDIIDLEGVDDSIQRSKYCAAYNEIFLAVSLSYFYSQVYLHSKVITNFYKEDESVIYYSCSPEDRHWRS